MKLNLTTKTVKAKTRRLKANWTSSNLQDLQNLHGFNQSLNFFKYKYENQEEIEIIEKYFHKEDIFDDYIYYSTSKRIIRKVKIEILNGEKLAEILRKILKNSEIGDDLFERRLTNDLTNELAKEIDKEILKNISKLK